MKALIVSLAFALFAPACAVHTLEGDVAVRRVGVTIDSRPRCHPSRYWNGRRCVKKRHWRGRYHPAHHHKHHHHHHYDD